MKADKYKVELLMARRGLSKADIIQASGIAASTFTRAMNGDSVKPDTFGKIAKAFDVDVTDIIEDKSAL